MYFNNMPSDALHTVEQGDAWVELRANGIPEAGGFLDQADANWTSFFIADLGEGGPTIDVTGQCDLFTVDLNGNPILLADCGQSIVGNTTAHLHRGPTNASPIDLDLSGGILREGGLLEINSITPDLFDDLRRVNGSNFFDLDFPNGAVAGGGPKPCVTTSDTACLRGKYSVTVQRTRNGPLFENVRGAGSSTIHNNSAGPGGIVGVRILPPGPFAVSLELRAHCEFGGGQLITVTNVVTGTVQEFTMPANGYLSEPL